VAEVISIISEFKKHFTKKNSTHFAHGSYCRSVFHILSALLVNSKVKEK